MKELVKMSINIHIFFTIFTIFLALVNIYIVKKCNNYIKMTKRVELFTPLYYLSLSILIFTGSVILAVYKFHLKSSVFLMIVASLFIIAGAFKTYQLFKMTRVKDIVSQKKFRDFAYKKYLLDTMLLIFTTTIALSI